MQCIVNGAVANYEVSGRGPKTLLLLHGWGDTQTTFKQLRAEMDDDFTCISLDLPGFGKSDPPREAYNLQDYASFVANFLKKIEATDIWAVIGHSNGGAIAIKGLATRTFSAKRLVLLASAGIRQSYTKRGKALRLAAKTIKQPTKLLPKQIQTKLKKKAYQAVGSELFVAEHLQDTFKKIVSEDLRQLAADVTQPTLLVYGDKDTATPATYGKLFADSIPTSRLEIVEGAEHFLHHGHVSLVATNIKDFLK